MTADSFSGDGTQSSVPPPDIGRSRVGRYDIIYPIARGGMAGVWAGRLSGMAGFEKLVAVKVIHPHLAQDPEFVKMFLDEARLAAKIHHPNVGEIYEVGEENGLFYMAGELILGRNLGQLFKKAAERNLHIPFEVSAEIAARVCHGLHKAHCLEGDDGILLNLVHRDVSPQNIIISYDGYVKLIDFGVAFARDRLTTTEAGAVKGKLRFMAPEQFRGEPIDGRSDLFSLGIILYQMVMGKHPFPGSIDATLINKILNGEYLNPCLVNPQIDPDLSQILVKALQTAPEDRYSNTSEMAQALESWIQTAGGKSIIATLSELMNVLFSEEKAEHSRRLQEHNSVTPPSNRGIFPGLPDKQLVSSEPHGSTGARFEVEAGGTMNTGRGFPSVAIILLTVAVPLLIIFAWSLIEPTDEVQPPILPTIQGHQEPQNTIVAIDLNISPEDASLELDGAPIETGTPTLHLPANGETHTLRISAAGHLEAVKTFTADNDGAIEVILKEISTGPRNNHRGRGRQSEPEDLDDESLRKNPYQ